MPLSKLKFTPGINRETTSYSNEGGWFDCDKVRFRSGFPEKIGGWVKIGGNAGDATAGQFEGVCRSLHPFTDLATTKLLGVGTHTKFYVLEGISYQDVTPIRITFTGSDTNNCFTVVNGSTTVTLGINSHGAVTGDFVTFSGATAVGGVVAADLNKEFKVTVVNANSFTIVVANAATSSATGGGTSITAAFQLNIGLNTVVPGTGWGAGGWSRSSWDSPNETGLITDELRIWGQDNFGEDLIFNNRNGNIYYWDRSASSVGSAQRAITLAAYATSLGVTDATIPQIAKDVIVSDRDRHVIAFGCGDVSSPTLQDPLLIRFSSQENPAVWNPTATNTAGSLRVGAGSQIVSVVETRQQILVFTDVSVHAMQFLGPPFTFGINQISENTTIMGPNATVPVDDSVFWMGAREFYTYAGSVQKLPCSVLSYVFDDFNYEQSDKVYAGLNSAFGEIWWFYPSEGSAENNRYVIYNYEQKVWYIGALERTAWIDRGINVFPVATGGDSFSYTHEFTLNDGSTTPASAITAYIESSQIDIADGESFMFIRRLIPDLTFKNSTATAPSADFIVKTRDFPGAEYDNTSTSEVARSATVPVEKFTDQAHIRLRGRSVAVTVQSDQTDTTWRLGSPRLDIRPDGRRS